jgi:hypothetical protein
MVRFGTFFFLFLFIYHLFAFYFDSPLFSLALHFFLSALSNAQTQSGAMRVLYEVGKASLATTGQFINCEDGLQIPW